MKIERTIANWPSLLRKGKIEILNAYHFQFLEIRNQVAIIKSMLNRGSVSPANTVTLSS